MPDKPRILVVDQDPQGYIEIQQLLANSRLIVVGGVGYDQEALSLASEFKPQVILFALEQPIVLPLQTMRALTNLLPETPIVTYSSLDDVHSVRQAKVFGAHEHLTKPLSLKKLTSSMERALDGASDLAGSQEESLPERRGSTVVTVFGPKGGTGRTLLSVNLAAAMAKAGLSPVLLDLDPASGDVARRMRLRVDRSLSEAAQHCAVLDELTVDSYLNSHPSGVKVLPAPREPTDWREIAPKAVDRLITLFAKVHEFIIIDTPSSFTDLSLLAAHRADVVLLLSSLDPSSIESTAIALKMLNSSQAGAAKTRLTLNHLTPANRRSDADAVRELSHELFWSLPYDETIAHRDEAGRPAVICEPKAKISRSISMMASHLTEARSPASHAPVPGNGSSLLSRVLGISA